MAPRPPAGIVTSYGVDTFPRLDVGGRGSRNLAVVFNDPPPATPSTQPAPASARSTVSFLVVN